MINLPKRETPNKFFTSDRAELLLTQLENSKLHFKLESLKDVTNSDNCNPKFDGDTYNGFITIPVEFTDDSGKPETQAARIATVKAINNLYPKFLIDHVRPNYIRVIVCGVDSKAGWYTLLRGLRGGLIEFGFDDDEDDDDD